MKVSLARYGKPSSTATLQASPLLGETDGAWLITTYLEKGLETVGCKPHMYHRHISDDWKKRGVAFW